jgi:phosphonoacetaldehyde hydrolase
MDVLAPAARVNGFDPDHFICADDVPAGRPAPWMLFRSAERLGVYPMSSVAVVDDTVVGVQAARHAGAWAVAVTKSGNALGMSEAEVQQAPPADIAARLASAEQAFHAAGAHAVIHSVADLLPVLTLIEERNS